MSPDSFTETTRQSWGSRLGGSLKGILVGLALFIAAFPLLFWNEGRAVKRHKTLQEGGGEVISVPAGPVDPANEGRLVHVTGEAVTAETLVDEEMSVSVPGALRLRRTALMYQWQERQESETKKKLGGGTETVTTYTYEKGWHGTAIDSTGFREPEGHANPGSMPFRDRTIAASDVRLGAFRLTPSLVARIGGFDPVSIQADAPLPTIFGEGASVANGGYYVGADPASPAVGDIRISFESVGATTASLVSRQVGGTFEPYRAAAGGTIELLQTGTHSAESMFETAERQNVMLAWILRIAGLLLMAFGLGAVLRPLAVLGDVVPFIGSLIGAGTGLAAFLLALVFSLLTISVAWFFYRPLLGMLLLAGAVAAFMGLRKLAGRKGAPAASGSAA